MVSILLLAIVAVVLAACGQAGASGASVEEKWAASAHANAEARSFTRWDDNDPAAIPAHCAKCHSTPGYLDYLGADGSTPGQVDAPAPTGTTVQCDACHNDVAKTKDFALMPSGLEVGGLGMESNCMECHQGRASTVQVDEAVAGLDPDTVETDLSLPNLHNQAPGATQYGVEAVGGYEYEGKTYLPRYQHVAGFNTCITCHDAHLLQVPVETCSACHLGVKTAEDLPHIRTSRTDFDGDGDVAEGLASEIATVQGYLWRSMQLYAAFTEGAEFILLEDGRFVDKDGESYATWTPRLLKAAYNYTYSAKEPGSYGHNGRYIIQLLYDSIEDLGTSANFLTRPPGAGQ
jgi:hypothetical protein